MSDEPTVYHVDRVDLTFEPRAWDFADERRVEIDAFFAEQVRLKPAMWNGRVLMLYRPAVNNGVFSGAYLETDYASFSAWGRWGRPETGVYDCFGSAAMLSADGAFLLGRMGPHTFNAGQIYFASGTPDLGDIIDGKVDLEFNVRRELMEETGLEIGEFAEEPGWTTLIDGGLIGHLKVLRSSEKATVLRERILDIMSREEQPELSDIVIARGVADLDPAMPRFIRTFLARRFGGA
jgi:8-oxo-dGTP pyrophosphatase MutT (NUDIX family)